MMKLRMHILHFENELHHLNVYQRHCLYYHKGSIRIVHLMYHIYEIQHLMIHHMFYHHHPPTLDKTILHNVHCLFA